MKKAKYLIFLLLAFNIVSCSHDYYDPQQFGKDYCNCMEKEDARTNQDRALAVCKGKLTKLYPLYKIAAIDMHTRSKDTMPYQTYNRVAKFMTKSMSYIRENCCVTVGMCTDSSVVKK